MINNIPPGAIRNLLNIVNQSPSKAGTIVKAQVVDITDDGSALLRLMPGGNTKGSMQGPVIKANAEIPLTIGQTLFLQIAGSKDNIQLKFISEAGHITESAKQPVEAKLLDMLVQLSGSKLSTAEAKLLLTVIRSLSPSIKDTFPKLKVLENILQKPEQSQNTILKADTIRNLLTLTGQADRPLAVKAGTIVKAEVIESAGKGQAVLRIIASDSKGTNIPGATIKTDTQVPLIKGNHVSLEILGGTDKLKMRIIDGSQQASEASRQTIPIKFLDMFAQISESRLNNSEFKLLLNLLNSLPQTVKTKIPEFQKVDKLMVDIKQLDGKILKAFVESSGVAFETRLKIAALKDPGSMLQHLMALQADGDLKALLLNLKKLLKDQSIVNTLKKAGFKIAELSSTTDNFIKHIEFFQFTSKFNDMFYTFLPVLWDDLKDGEFVFKKDRRQGKKAYSCGINLDLEALGKLSISVTISDKAFYLTFHAEQSNVANLIRSQKHILEERFVSQGLTLKAINIEQRSIAFGESQRQEVNIKT